MQTRTLTVQRIAESFGWSTLAKARHLCQQKAVLDWGFDVLRTKIRGRVQELSRQNPYRVEVHWENGGQSGGILLSGRCTCPDERDCVHAAAVALMAEADLQDGAEDLKLDAAGIDLLDTETPASTSHLSRWLARLSDVFSTGVERNHSDEFVIYVLNNERRFGQSNVQIEPQITRRLKTGGIAASRAYEWRQLASSQGRFMQESDGEIAKLWVALSPKDYQIRPPRPLLPPEDAEVLDLLFTRIILTGRAFWNSKLEQPLILGSPREGRVEWVVGDDGYQSPHLVLDQPGSDLQILNCSSPWYVDVSSFEAGPIKLPFSQQQLRTLCSAPRIAPKDAAAVGQALQDIGEHLPMPMLEVSEEERTGAPTPCITLKFEKLKHKVLLSDGTKGRYIEGANFVVLSFDYGFDSSKLADSWETYRWSDGKKHVLTRRARKFEQEVAARLSDLGFCRFGFIRRPPTLSVLVPRYYSQEAWLRFVQESLPQLCEEGWKVDVDRSFQYQVVEASGDWLMQLDNNAGWWFSLDLGIDIDGCRIPLLPILTEALNKAEIGSSLPAVDKLNMHGKFYASLPDGRLVALPFDRVRRILACLLELLNKESLTPEGRLPVSVSQVMALTELEQAENLKWHGERWLPEHIKEMKSFDFSTLVEEPSALRTSLRSYQQEGLRWLTFIAKFELGGLLADDMGLGKTVQALAHILIEKQQGRLDRPCLIVCPTSVIFNWMAEAQRLAPDLKVLSLHGPDRAARFQAVHEADVVLSTYPLLVKDVTTLSAVEWHAVILDEAQAIKNYDTKAAGAVLQLRSRYRLCLTGTPVENHLGELWSQFNFLIPGLLGDRKTFDRVFRDPIEEQGDPQRLDLLISRIKPFLLRRTKEQVARDLPAKTETVKHVELEGRQRDLYETVRLTMHREVLAEVKKRGLASCQLIVLDALMKLRQVCCDPRLVKLPAAEGVSESAKLECLKSMLDELMEEKRQILLFSQFTSMLDLIAADLRKRAIPFVELRGDTKDRVTPVRKFQGGEVPLFLISLKAGGTGLNLTAADTVIHYDPWWNPAVEDQASDRAHRIGQDKPVFVYRLVAAGTIEQRMFELQEHKRAIAGSVLQSGGAVNDVWPYLDETALSALFAPL